MVAAPPVEPFDVFLSHHSVDKPFVRLLHEELGRLGMTAWFDERELLDLAKSAGLIPAVRPSAPRQAVERAAVVGSGEACILVLAEPAGQAERLDPKPLQRIGVEQLLDEVGSAADVITAGQRQGTGVKQVGVVAVGAEANGGNLDTGGGERLLDDRRKVEELA